MGSYPSRRSRREALEDLAIARAKWRLRFYCWGYALALTLATVQGAVFAWDLLSHHPAQVLINLVLPVR